MAKKRPSTGWAMTIIISRREAFKKMTTGRTLDPSANLRILPSHHANVKPLVDRPSNFVTV
jgi:hypothetical protein